MCIKININNPDKKRKLDKGLIKSAALGVLKYFKRKAVLVDITFISDRKIRLLNKKYMRRNRPTDVISFPLKENSIPEGGLMALAILKAKPLPYRLMALAILKAKPLPYRLIGDIYVSYDTAYRNAKRFNTSFRKEISLYVIHGVLHLLGFGDKTAKEKKKMKTLENNFLTKATRSSKKYSVIPA